MVFTMIPWDLFSITLQGSAICTYIYIRIYIYMCAVQIQHLRISNMYNLWQSQCHSRVLELGFITFLVEMLSVIKPIPAMAEAMMMQAKWLKPRDLSQRRNVKRCSQTWRSRYISGLFLEGSMMIIYIYTH